MARGGTHHHHHRPWRTSVLARGLVALPLLLVLALAPPHARAQDGGSTVTGTRSDASVPSGPYTTYTSTLHSSDVVAGDASSSSDVSSTSTNSTDPNATPVSSDDLTDLVGTRTAVPTFAGNETFTSSGTPSPVPTNTQACNNYVEFCTRRYSNISFISCHNSPFVREGNAAANQRYGATEQLNDGVRLLQGQMHLNADGVPHLCHGSCDILDAGPLTDWLTEIKTWLDHHRYDVVTILIGNADPYPDPSAFVSYIESTGIVDYAYHAPQMPMALADWPTLGEMIILGKRAVIMLDYKADYAKWPWLLDEFGVMWETPFDPLDRSFPCVVERPPDLSPEDARNSRMYLMNHNLNVEFSLLGTSILVPARTLLNVTNAVSGNSSLGNSASQCRADWGRPPNFLNVDYYDEGSYPGSVFEVAALMNGVEYTPGQCCGVDSGSLRLEPASSFLLWTAVWLGVSALFLA